MRECPSDSGISLGSLLFEVNIHRVVEYSNRLPWDAECSFNLTAMLCWLFNSSYFFLIDYSQEKGRMGSPLRIVRHTCGGDHEGMQGNHLYRLSIYQS